MLRIITMRAGDGGATLGLEGRLMGPWVDELRRSCEYALATGTPLTLDLAEVAFVARDGARLLRDLTAGGVTVVNCPAFVTEQLRALSPC
jgi:hypothetical protein